MESLIKVKDGQQMESPRGGLGMVQRGDSFVAGEVQDRMWGGSRERRGYWTVWVEGEGVRPGRFGLWGQVYLTWRK